ncbi:MAG: class I SAM-dependent methyltransferase [Methanosarcinaceae archaeon]|nr:class I SAM-dependent methyltransferase [Methanosarcinaceae archaeon]
MGSDSKSQDFPYIAEHVFAPIYPVIASQIIGPNGIREGICLDLGCGIASLGIAIVEQTNILVYAVDISKKMCGLSKDKAAQHSVSGRLHPVVADVHRLPFADECANLVVSRGSVFFWKDLPAAFREVVRVLAPEGEAWVGGGFGTAKLRRQISKIMVSMNSDWHESAKERLSSENMQAMLEACRQTGLPFHTVNDDSGFWVVINKKG